MELRTVGLERRSGQDRRRYSDPSYHGPERRGGVDRRCMAGAVRQVRAQLGSPAARGGNDQALAHHLLPPNGHRFLSPLVVVTRIVREFAYVEADEEEGCRQVQTIMNRLSAGNRYGRNDERLEHLATVRDRAVYVCFGDNPGAETEWLCALVVPNEPLLFEYESLAHARSVQGLLRRCANALGYEIAGVPAVNGYSELRACA